MRIISFFIILINIFPRHILGQSYSTGRTTKPVLITLKELEEKFRQNNLLLLAAKFQIDAKKAAIIQAKLYANPSIYLEQATFNDRTDRYVDFTRHGQTVVQIQQLFLLGSKIEKRTKVAEIDTRISEEKFRDTLRALKYELRSTFVALYYYREALQFYDQSVTTLQKTVENSEKAYQSRAILLSELLRLKALLFFLSNERTEFLVEVRQREAVLKVLMNDPEYMDKEIIPVVDSKVLDSLEVNKLSPKGAIDLALEFRPDLKAAVQGVKYEEANLALQQAKAIPDLSFGPVYNRGGTHVPNFFGFSMQMTVPLFDRNQGNIEAAEKAILEKRSVLQNQIIQIENEVFIELNRANEKDKIYKEFKDKFTDDYKKLAQLMVTNYQKRYLTIIEFADFFETYRNSIVQVLKLQTERIEAIERLNYTVGKTFLSIQPGVE